MTEPIKEYQLQRSEVIEGKRYADMTPDERYAFLTSAHGLWFDVVLYSERSGEPLPDLGKAIRSAIASRVPV